MIIPVILSGGTGSRLWPVSRDLYPKQLLSLVNNTTMLQDTALRTKGIANMGSPIVVCNEEHRFMVAEQLRQAGYSASSIILEPCGRNTAPAIAVAALEALSHGNNPVLLVLPADHVITNISAFQAAVEAGAAVALLGNLATFGIVPTSPETGYGYIKSGGNIEANGEQTGSYSVERFVEKPDRANAELYLASGNYYWNSGIFVFTAQSYLDELEFFAPGILSACRESFSEADQDKDFIRLKVDSFSRCPSDSIDYAVMEKTSHAAMIPLDAGWSDVGSWSALWEICTKDDCGNVLKGDVLLQNTCDCLISAESRLVAAVGVSDHIIVETPDAVLVAHRDHVQDVKAIVRQLNDKGRHEAIRHRKIYRPWGAYETVDMDERFQVKRITVKSGAALSLQKHHHRAEHWIVVKGTATVTKGEEVILLSENQSIYIPLGVTHRLENPGVIPLELIEVQSGSYLGEDDIVRLEDTYGRI